VSLQIAAYYGTAGNDFAFNERELAMLAGPRQFAARVQPSTTMDCLANPSLPIQEVHSEGTMAAIDES
jgi:hypothetical protein